MQGRLPGAELGAYRTQRRHLLNQRGNGRPVAVVQRCRLAVVAGTIAQKQAQSLRRKILRYRRGVNVPLVFECLRRIDAGTEHTQGPVAVAEVVVYRLRRGRPRGFALHAGGKQGVQATALGAEFFHAALADVLEGLRVRLFLQLGVGVRGKVLERCANLRQDGGDIFVVEVARLQCGRQVVDNIAIKNQRRVLGLRGQIVGFRENIPEAAGEHRVARGVCCDRAKLPDAGVQRIIQVLLVDARIQKIEATENLGRGEPQRGELSDEFRVLVVKI
ncbi:Uncharacterised protein [Mycobacterium tuberculosis]|nr:Uncharacterised protein [Mycobacterium tuberculosis]